MISQRATIARGTRGLLSETKLLGVLGGCGALALSTLARADDTASSRAAAAARAAERPHTIAELGFGLLTLPGAEVCIKTGCSNGDSSIEVDLWQMYRATRYFAVGAGATLAIRPTTDNFRSEVGGFERTHTRSYFLVEAQGRFYTISRAFVELWFGGTVGGVVLSDRYKAEDNRTGFSIIGPSASTVRTEGLSLGGLVGADWSFSQNWSLGINLRYMRWFLPHEPATTVFGDRATLTDGQNVFNFDLAIAYRIAL